LKAKIFQNSKLKLKKLVKKQLILIVVAKILRLEKPANPEQNIKKLSVEL
jgi:hypothetical protein